MFNELFTAHLFSAGCHAADFANGKSDLSGLFMNQGREVKIVGIPRGLEGMELQPYSGSSSRY
jgi:hypothetical protein